MNVTIYIKNTVHIDQLTNNQNLLYQQAPVIQSISGWFGFRFLNNIWANCSSVYVSFNPYCVVLIIQNHCMYKNLIFFAECWATDDKSFSHV